MMIVERYSRVKREGDYYRVMDRGELIICHMSHIRRLRENENID